MQKMEIFFRISGSGATYLRWQREENRMERNDISNDGSNDG